jgi:hypothetical protein
METTTWRTKDWSILGIELIPSAVRFAQSTVRDTRIRFCQADGTKLQWITSASADFIASFGGFLHIPSANMCDTVHQITSKLRPGGVAWGGYIDTWATATSLLSCTLSLSNYPIEAVLVDENKLWKGCGIPRVYRRKKPVSIFWQRKDCSE